MDQKPGHLSSQSFFWLVAFDDLVSNHESSEAPVDIVA